MRLSPAALTTRANARTGRPHLISVSHRVSGHPRSIPQVGWHLNSVEVFACFPIVSNGDDERYFVRGRQGIESESETRNTIFENWAAWSEAQVIDRQIFSSWDDFLNY